MEIIRLKKGKPYLFADVAKWGGKGDNLSRLGQVWDVPHGFTISADTYPDFVNNAELKPVIRRAERQEEPSQAYQTIRQAFLEADFERGLVERLDSEFSTVKTPAAARSSSISEDGDQNSFAGRHETVLGITNLKELLIGIKEVYASLFTPLSIDYRKSQGLDSDNAIAVVVQQMIEPVVAGVAYSPSPNDQNEILIESSWGLGTSVVDGKPCDIYRVPDTITGNFEADISPKKREMDMFDVKKKTVAMRKVPTAHIGKSSLTDRRVREVAKTVKSIERAYGVPMDMEFVYERGTGQLYVLQARPVTGMSTVDDIVELPNILVNNILASSKNIRKTGIFEGPVVVVNGVDHVTRRLNVDGDIVKLNEQFKDGYVLIAPEIPPQLEEHITNARAMVVTECGTTGHAAAIACEKGIIYMGRVVSNVPDLLSNVRSGMQVGVAASKEEGILYLTSTENQPSA